MIILGAAVVACSNQQERHVVSLAALDDGSALVLWDDWRVAGIDRIKDDGSTTWSRVLAAEAQRAPLALHDRVVGVREIRNAKSPEALLTLEGFDLETGERVWETPLSVMSLESEGGRIDPIRAGLGTVAHVRTPHFLHAFVEDQIVMIDPGSGIGVQRLRSQAALVAPFRIENGFVARRNGLLAIEDDGTVTAYRDSVVGHGCASRGAFLRIVESWRQVALVEHSDHGDDVVVDVPFPSNRLVVGCALFEDKILLEVENTESNTLEVHAFDRAGNPRGLVSMAGSRALFDSMLLRAPDASSIGGELTRYVPYITYRGRSFAFVVVDLGRMAIVSESLIPYTSTLFRSMSYWYFATNTEVAAIDGTTGRLAGAVHVPEGFEPPSPASVKGGRLWLANTHPRSPALLLISLDARTLQPTFISGGMNVVDVTHDPNRSPLPSLEVP